MNKILKLRDEMLNLDRGRADGETSFPGLAVAGPFLVVPEWEDGMMVWRDLWAVQVGPFLFGRNWRGFGLFLSPARCAVWLQEA